MAWITENRRTQQIARRPEPYLTEALKKHISETYFHRYPTKRAVLLPALHAVQHEYNWIPAQALEELGEFLSLTPAEVLDTASFYEEYWLRPKGKYLLQVCRSLACEVCGSNAIAEHLEQKLGIEPEQTTPDGKFTLVELECLGACGEAPVMLCNEVLYTSLTPESLDRLIASLPEDPHDYRDAAITWQPDGHAPHPT
jgi:NADH-quinone oxidoreductase E subunit